MLQSGIGVCVPDANEQGRIEASSGTIAAHPADGDYIEGAILPTSRWLELPHKDCETMFETEAGRDPAATVKIVRLSPEILNPFRDLRYMARECDLEEVRRQVSRPEFSAAMRSCAKYARDQFGLNIPEETGHIVGGIRVNARSLRTVTVHPETGKFVGMHIDNWSRLPVSQRHVAPKRICVNLGDDVRYLLFVNFPVRHLIDEILAALARHEGRLGGDAEQTGVRRALHPTSGVSALARAFLETHPMYPVLRLKVYPGEAYIAPTENMIHDGSSVGARGQDVALSLREA